MEQGAGGRWEEAGGRRQGAGEGGSFVYSNRNDVCDNKLNDEFFSLENILKVIDGKWI